MKKEYIIMPIIAILLISLGFISSHLYNSYNGKVVNNNISRFYDGLRLEASNRTEADKIAYGFEGTGDWVCVNIKDMEFKRALEVCQHEVGHEIFAEECEKDFDGCLEKLK
jgi:hypothetical protein